MIIIGVTGGSGSGKTTFARKLASALNHAKVSTLAQDNYYIDQSHRFDGDGGSVNFDHPSALDFDLMALHVSVLAQGKSIQVPHYDFATHKRLEETTTLEPTDFLIVDGTMILTHYGLRTQLNHAVFISIPEEVRFQRRLDRDVRERGRTADGVHKQFFTQVKPMHDLFVEPQSQHAHFIATMENVEIILSQLLQQFK